jgi:hypothetical protein
MNPAVERRLAALEATCPVPRRAFLLMPWDQIPDTQAGDMVGLYNLVAVTPDGPKRVEYERNGIHPRDDVPGSWNRHLYFGEPFNA